MNVDEEELPVQSLALIDSYKDDSFGHVLPDVTELQSFLGMVGYYRKFIPKFAKICSILYNLTRIGVKFEWNK